MPHNHHNHGGALAGDDGEAPSPRPSAAGCYTFLRHASKRSDGYRRLDPAAAAAVRVEVGTSWATRSVFHVEPAVLEAAGPVRRLLAAAGRRVPGGAVAVAVDALLFEHLLWLQAAGDGGSAADLEEIVEFYSQDL